MQKDILETTLEFTETSNGVLTRTCDETWRGLSGVVGGYTQALALRAMERAVDDPSKQPLTLQIQFLRPIALGEVRATVDVRRSGRTLTNATCELSSGGKLAAVASAVFATRQEKEGFLESPPPIYEPPTEDESPADPSADLVAHDRYRFFPREGSFTRGAGRASVGGWLVPRWPASLTTSLLVMVADLWLPAAYHRWSPGVSVIGIDSTIHFRCTDLPSATPPALQLRLHTKASQEGYVDEDGEIWSDTGELLCQYRSMRLIL